LVLLYYNIFCHCHQYMVVVVTRVYRIYLTRPAPIFSRVFISATQPSDVLLPSPLPPTHCKRVLDLNVVNINGHRNSTLRNGCRGGSGDRMRACVRRRLAGYMLFLLRYYIMCVVVYTLTHMYNNIMWTPM